MVDIKLRPLYPQEITLILIEVAAVWGSGFVLGSLKMRIYPVSTGIRTQSAAAYSLVTMQTELHGPHCKEVRLFRYNYNYRFAYFLY
jgi:hypothetical protein